jgi:hypothetical protein
MMRVPAAVGVFALAVAGLAAAPTPDSVEVLVARLGSESFAERESAVAALEAAGPSAIPLLEAAAQSPNPETSRRASVVLAKLRRAGDSKDRLAVKTVRLSYKSVPLGTAVNDLKARTKINLTLDPANVADPLRLVTCETGDLPPWQAVEEFCKAAGLKEVFAAELPVPKAENTRSRKNYYQPPPPPPAAEAVPVTLADGKYVAHAGTRSGAVRVLALPGTFPAHRVNLGTGDLVFNFDVTPLPGLHWQEVTGVRVTRLIDDAGRFGSGGTVRDVVAPYQDYGNAVFIAGGGQVFFRGGFDGGEPVGPSSYPNRRVVAVPLRVATPTARSLKLLEGVVCCEMTVPNQPLATVENLMKRVGAEVSGAGGVKLTVQEAAATKNGAATVRVQTVTPSPWARQRFNQWGPMQVVVGFETTGPAASPIRAFDAAGKPVKVTVGETNTSGNDGTLTTSMGLTFPDGLPAKLVLMGPRPVVVEVPFKMENITLP